MAAEKNPGPLDGIFVLEVANWVAAPSAGAILADMGAQVVKVEPNEGDSMRYTQRQPKSAEGKPQQNGQVLDHSFTLNNRGKKSIAVDLGSIEGQGLVKELAKQADVLLTNLLPGRLAKYGLGYAELSATNPRLVYASVSGWGLQGPNPDKAAFDRTAFFAQGGVLGLLGAEGAPPISPRSGQGDHQTGLAACSSILAALLLRHQTGKGSQCEVSLLRTATWNIAEDLAPALVDGAQPPKEAGDGLPIMIRSFETSDKRWLMNCMPIREDFYWPKFCRAVGMPELAQDERYNTAGKRAKARNELAALVAERIKTGTLQEWQARLDEEGCVAAPVATMGEVAQDPHLRANGAFQNVSHPAAGTFETVAAPFNIHGANVQVRGPGPEPGAHTEQVLTERLGLSAERIKELNEKKVLGFRPVPNTPLANWAAKSSKL